MLFASGESCTTRKHPTRRAADKWDSPRFLSFCLAWSFFCSLSSSPLRPLAANAGRWAAEKIVIMLNYFANAPPGVEIPTSNTVRENPWLLIPSE